jgi:hypothetical protein
MRLLENAFAIVSLLLWAFIAIGMGIWLVMAL